MTSPAIERAHNRSQHPVLRRLYGLALRHIYMHRGSWQRVVEMMYWPVVNMATWGFTSLYVTKRFADVDVLASMLVMGVVMTEFFLRPTINSLMLFLEEVWSRNLGHLFASPLRMRDYVAGLSSLALLRTAIAIIPVLILAKFVFGFSPFATFGWSLCAYVPLLAVNGCIYGLMIVALLLRYGLATEWLCWMATWLFIPFFGPYYPVDILPTALQGVSRALPPTYVFEAMKAQMAGEAVVGNPLLMAALLTAVYAVVAAFAFSRAYRHARNTGGLLNSGE